ncbi:hypothetical protein DVH05_028244 [Phytophthora capsici]|nr:hypothetical protein DVH05_011164 [Phytophthora capsici]KAG1690365.1 hypothetical protein DVH05_028244 [Phytophthora capsici]
MKLTQHLQRRLDRKQEARAPTYENVSDIVNMLRDVAAEKNSKPGAGEINSVKTPPCISLDMFIAFREKFSGGWNLWLGEEEETTLTPELKQELPAMTFDEKA